MTKRTAGILCIALLAMWGTLVVLAQRTASAAQELVDYLFNPALAVTYISTWLIATAWTRDKVKLSFAAIVTTLNLVAVVALCEVLAALGWMDWARTLRSLAGDVSQYESSYVEDPELGFRRVPDRQWSERPRADVEKAYGQRSSFDGSIEFTYDRWGYRNSTDIPDAHVVLLGDSFVEGHNVSDDQTLAAILQSELGQPVANLGVAGYGTLQALRVLRGDAVAKRPETVVWFFFEGNDLYDDESFEAMAVALAKEEPQPTTVPARWESWWTSSFTRAVSAQIRYWSQPLLPKLPPYWAKLTLGDTPGDPVYFFDYGAVPWTDYERARWRVAQDAFTEGARFCAARGIRLILAYVPTKYRVYRDFIEIPDGSPVAAWSTWPLPRLFMDFCGASGLECVDLTAPLERATKAGDNPYFRTDTHWSPAGQRLVGSVIAERVRGLG